MISFTLKHPSRDANSIVDAIVAKGYKGTSHKNLLERINTLLEESWANRTFRGVQAVVLDEEGTFFGAVWHDRKDFLGGFVCARGKRIYKPSSMAAELDYHVERLERFAKEYEAKARPHSLEVGDVLRYVWGYEQTIVSFFEVIEVKGNYVVYREIEKATSYNADTIGNFDSMTGSATPLLGCYIGTPVTAKADGNNTVSMNRGRASKMEYSIAFGIRTFEPSNWTAYA